MHDRDAEYIETPWIVREVKAQDDYTLLLRFEDGKRGVYNMWPLIKQYDGGDDVFVPLEDIDLFMKAYLDCDTACWPTEISDFPAEQYDCGHGIIEIGFQNDLTIAPEELYANCMSLRKYARRSRA